MIPITDTVGQIAYVREEYLIAVIVPGLLAGGDGKCRVVFVGGIIEVTRAEAQRVLALICNPLTGEVSRRAGVAAAN